MKRSLLAIVGILAVTPLFAADVGVSISVGEPGFYGRLDIGKFPQPEVIYREPMIIERVVGVSHPPMYLHVPPGHAKDWRKHCRKYDACGRPVYFVRDNWYNDVYVPRYREHHGKGHGNGKDHGKGHDKGSKHN